MPLPKQLKRVSVIAQQIAEQVMNSSEARAIESFRDFLGVLRRRFPSLVCYEMQHAVAQAYHKFQAQY